MTFSSISGTGVTEELSTKVSAGANYIGSMFSNAWTKTAKTANDATTSSSSFLSSAFNKVGGGSATTSAGNLLKVSFIQKESEILGLIFFHSVV